MYCIFVWFLIVAYLNEADENHTKALKIVKDVDRGKYGASVITDYIFDDVVTVMLVKTKNLLKVAELAKRSSAQIWCLKLIETYST